jgi:hypothetical protein
LKILALSHLLELSVEAIPASNGILSAILGLDGVIETRVLFRMMGKAKTAMKMRLALLSAKCKTLFIKRGDVGERSGNQNLCLRRSS